MLRSLMDSMVGSSGKYIKVQNYLHTFQISMRTFSTSLSVAAGAIWLYYASVKTLAAGTSFPSVLPPQTVVSRSLKGNNL
jgi:hypothetical protein